MNTHSIAKIAAFMRSDFSTSLTNPVRPLVSPFHQSSRQLIAPPTHLSVRHCADQSADNGPDRGSAKRDPSSIATVMDVMNDLMPWRRRRRAMRTVPPVMRRSNRRASRQNHPIPTTKSFIICRSQPQSGHAPFTVSTLICSIREDLRHSTLMTSPS